ncbi:MAG: tol-pal system protein YbgF [Alphaproteobacteria bacterium]
MRRSLLILLALPLLATAALAQDADDTSALTDKVNQLQRDVTFLQRQVYGGAGAPEGGNAPLPAAPVAANQVQISQLQEQIRELRGEIEQLQYQNKQLTDAEKKFEADVDYRLQALEKNTASVAAATPAAAEPAKAAAPAEPAQYAPKDQLAPVTPTATAPAATGKDFPNANEHYNYAFKLFNAKDYSNAAVSFDDFVHKYPNDPLTANAYYWLGESYYARNDYTRAADSFRKGYEAGPNEQKAPDNLYKLAMSLAAIKRTGEACIVLGQVIDKYGDANPHTKEKATAARVSLQCK